MPEELEQITIDQKEECSLFDFTPDWSGTNTKVPVTAIESLGFGASIPQIDINKETLNAFKFSFDYIISGYSDLKSLTDFFSEMKGKNASFCLPSWTTDLVLSQNVSAGSSTVHVVSVEPNIYIGCNLFFYFGGEYFTRKITNIVGLVLTLDVSIPIDISSDTPISIVYRVTFSDDVLNIDYVTNNIGKVSLGFIEERRETAQQGETIDG